MATTPNRAAQQNEVSTRGMTGTIGSKVVLKTTYYATNKHSIFSSCNYAFCCGCQDAHFSDK